jgi:predicted RNA-binding protein YlxR (DUF448 family)
MEPKKHIAIRTCIATGKKMNKKDMIRLAISAEGTVVVDLKGKVKGRGANLSADIAAFDEAIKKKAIQRALKLDRKQTKEEIDLLRKDFESAIQEKALRMGVKKVVLKISKEEFGKITSK